MGCDIHAVIEYHRYKHRDGQPPRFGGEPMKWPQWTALGEIDLYRDYTIFGAMAGMRGVVRDYIEPRGLPADASARTFDLNWLRIDHDGDGAASDVRAVSVVEAEKWHNRFSAPYWGSYRPVEITTWTSGQKETAVVGTEHAGKPTHVSDPDNHTHSWLTAEEFADALARAEAAAHQEVDWEGFTFRRSSVEYYAALAAMQAIEAEGVPARIVFWFDN